MSKVFLIDGSSLMYRAYYATAYTGNLMQNAQGVHTNAVFAFCNMMQKIIDLAPDAIFVAFDAGKHTFRHQEYQGYKGGRKPMPLELHEQIPNIKKYLDLMNIKRFETPDFEADDIICAYAKLVKEKNDVFVITGDKDLLQLVDKNVKVMLMKKGISDVEEYNNENFYSLAGIYPFQITDYKGLVGDASDNLPGIKGIGDKTAKRLLFKYATMENIFAKIDEIKGKTGNLLKEGKDAGLMSKRLATLASEIILPYTLDDIKISEPDYLNLASFFRELEFKMLLKKAENKYLNSLAGKSDALKEEVETADASYDFSSFADTVIVGESFKENYISNPLIGISLYDIKSQKKVFVFDEVIARCKSLREYLLSNNKKIIYDYKKIYVCLRLKGIKLAGVVFDPLLASYVINPNYAADDVKSCLDHFGSSDLNYDENIYGYRAKAAVPETGVLKAHSIKKCLAIYNMLPVLKAKLKEFGQEELFAIELALSSILGDMETDGLKVDADVLTRAGEDLKRKAEALEREIYRLAGVTFNINSVKQLGEVLFEKMGLPAYKKNKRGYSTASEVLEKLADRYRIARLILDYREVAKIISVYVEGLKENIDKNSFVHPLYKQTLTATGRLSSVSPNIQNMPLKSKLGQVIRSAFVSRFKDGLILSCDYSQIELRVLAHLAGDEAMISSFKRNVDFHAHTASMLYDVPEDEVTPEMRRNAKAINFGIIYGMSAWGLSESIHISPQAANAYIFKYFLQHPQVREYREKTIAEAKEKGYTKTIFNRVRYINDIKSSNRNISAFAERTALNAPIQGSAADIIKKAMVDVKNAIKGMKSVLIAQVHDELLFDVYPGELDVLRKAAEDAMVNAASLNVKLVVKSGSGKNWLEV